MRSIFMEKTKTKSATSPLMPGLNDIMVFPITATVVLMVVDLLTVTQIPTHTRHTHTQI